MANSLVFNFRHARKVSKQVSPIPFDNKYRREEIVLYATVDCGELMFQNGN